MQIGKSKNPVDTLKNIYSNNPPPKRQEEVTGLKKKNIEMSR